MLCESVLNRLSQRLNPVLNRVGLKLYDCHRRILFSFALQSELSYTEYRSRF